MAKLKLTPLVDEARATLRTEERDYAVHATTQALREKRETVRILRKIEAKIESIQETFDADTALDF